MILKAALIANAASLGYNWIYDMPYLKRLSESKSLLFQKANQTEYDAAKNAYFAYPKSEIGDVSFQGNIAIWLYQALKENFALSSDLYEDVIFNHIKQGGDYEGYIESFGRKLIEDRNKMNQDKNFISQFENDDQLVGFIPWIVFREVKRPTISGLKFTRVFSTDTNYDLFFDLFNSLSMRASTHDLQSAIKLLVEGIPEQKRLPFTKAIEMDNTPYFIKDYAGTACSIGQALPVIIHILYHSRSFEDIINKNTTIGGASSDRGMLLGAIASFFYEIPKHYFEICERSLRYID